MLKRLLKEFKYGKKGFTLIELLVVVAILGVLAAVAIPNVAKFIGSGKSEAAKTELANVQTAVTAAMAKAQVGTITGAATAPADASDATNLSNAADLTVDGPVTDATVGEFLSGTYTKLNGTYAVATDGSVWQKTYP